MKACFLRWYTDGLDAGHLISSPKHVPESSCNGLRWDFINKALGQPHVMDYKGANQSNVKKASPPNCIRSDFSHIMLYVSLFKEDGQGWMYKAAATTLGFFFMTVSFIYLSNLMLRILFLCFISISMSS